MRKEGAVFEGKTLDDAVRKGLEALGLSRAEVMITMLEEGSGGFLGIGARPYRVRIMPRPGGAIAERDEDGGRDRQGRRRRERSRRGSRAGSSAEPAARGDRHASGRGGRRRGEDRREGPVATAPDRTETGSERGSARRGRRRRPRRGAGPDRGARTREPVSAARTDPGRPDENGSRVGASSPTPPVDEGPARSPEELRDEGKRLTEELLRYMGFSATVEATVEGDRVDVTARIAEGEELVTGRKGEVRQALQHLLNLMLNRGGRSRYHLQLEINDFWQRREQELREMALSLADQALASEAEAVTEYLNAQERRIVHMALRDDARVKTYALGTGLIKRIAVAPAGFPEGPEAED